MIKPILIPKSRIPVVVGKNGETKKNIERMTSTKIEINEDVLIEGKAIDIMNANNIITAIGRGFSPKKAMELMDENNCFYMIPLPHDRKTLIRVRARIIGTNGKCKRMIENLTNTSISVYGKTASIIGSFDDVDAARDAIERLVKGSPHKNVYRLLQSRK